MEISYYAIYFLYAKGELKYCNTINENRILLLNERDYVNIHFGYFISNSGQPVGCFKICHAIDNDALN